MSDSKEMLSYWRRERATGVAEAICYSGMLLAVVVTAADIVWSEPHIIFTDLLLLLGCGASLYWRKKDKTSTNFWMPVYWTFWISILPSIWTSGGINSPFLGVDLAALYVLAVVLDSRGHSKYYFAFTFGHIPVFAVIEYFYPLSLPGSPSFAFSAIINAVTLAVVALCIIAFLKTESRLADEFSESEKVLKKRENQLREAQTIARIGSWEWDVIADHITWSEEMFKIFQMDKSNFNPSFRGHLQRAHPEQWPELLRVIEHSLATGKDFLFEHRIEREDDVSYVHTRGRVVRNEAGEVVKMLGTSQDITDRKKIETASDAKMQFLANMSHEIRSPMNAILGFADLLQADETTPLDRSNYLARIRANGAQLLRLIDDILDLSKFEAGQIPVEAVPLSLKNLIDDVSMSFSPTLERKKLELKVVFQSEIPRQVQTDPLRLRQILVNLVGNAIKFTHEGGVSITVASLPVNSVKDKMMLEIDIEDTGIGISREKQSALFQPFTQADSSIARKYGGTGLGLVLSKRLSEALGGDLKLLRSDVGEGTHFKLRVPVAIVRRTETTESNHDNRDLQMESLRGRHILLAEDSPDNSLVVCHYLSPFGMNIEIATNGFEVLEKVKEKKFDCVLMDLQMPGMDGLEATRKLRQDGFKQPIIALTAHALAEERARSIQAGCNVHITKPINKFELIETLSSQVSAV